MMYTADARVLFRQVARPIHRVLRGDDPGTIPVEGPEKLELIVNLNVARALGLTIPPSLLQRAAHVIDDHAPALR